QALDAKVGDDGVRGVADIFQRQLRKGETVRLAGGGIDGRRAGGALVAAQRVHADHEPSIAVDRLAGAGHFLPPARAGIFFARHHVRAGRQAGQYEYGVVARKVQRAPGLVGDMRAVQFAATLHRERRGQRKVAACVAHRQCTLSMVILTGELRSTAPPPASPSRSPDWAIGWPPWLILAPTKTCAALDSLSVGAMAIASLRVTVAGSLTGSSLATASGIGGPSGARA